MDTIDKTAMAVFRPKVNAFFNARTALRLLENVGTVGCWDFNTALGNTVRDKYDSLFVKIVELSNVLLGRGAHGLFWIVCSPEVFSIMDVAAGDTPKIVPDGEQQPMKLIEGQLMDMGVLAKRWRIFVTEQWPTETILVGADYEERPPEHYARLKICNFII